MSQPARARVGSPGPSARLPVLARRGGEGGILRIDFDADLNWVDDDDRNIAKVPGAAARFKAGDVAVAGRPGFLSRVRVEEVDGPWVFFRQIDEPGPPDTACS